MICTCQGAESVKRTDGAIVCKRCGLPLSEGVENACVVPPCGSPAPLVVNGGSFAGCVLPRDHDGQHVVTVKWSA